MNKQIPIPSPARLLRAAVLLTAFGLLCLSGLTGCASYKLPEVSGSLVEYHRSDPLGGTTITAKGVRVTDAEVAADEVVFDTKYPSWSVYLKVQDYKRARNQ